MPTEGNPALTTKVPVFRLGPSRIGKDRVGDLHSVNERKRGCGGPFCRSGGHVKRHGPLSAEYDNRVYSF